MKQLKLILKDKPSNVEDIVRLALRIDDCFSNIYKSLAKSAETETVKAFFNNLLEKERHDKLKVTRNILSMSDL